MLLNLLVEVSIGENKNTVIELGGDDEIKTDGNQ